jgi:hypothetical protein
LTIIAILTAIFLSLILFGGMMIGELSRAYGEIDQLKAQVARLRIRKEIDDRWYGAEHADE